MPFGIAITLKSYADASDWYRAHEGAASRTAGFALRYSGSVLQMLAGRIVAARSAFQQMY
jgi:hypothetical protein